MKKTVSVFLVLLVFCLSISASFGADIINADEMISPRGMCFDEEKGRIIVADSIANAIFEIDIKTLEVKRISGASAGKDMYGLPVGGYVDGKVESAMFSAPADVALLENGAIVVADTGNNAIRQIYLGEVTTIAGGKEAGLSDGYRQIAKFDAPSALAVMQDGSLLVSDTENNAIRKISDAGSVKTLAVEVKKPAGIFVSEKDIFVCELETSSILVFRENDKKATKVAGSERGFANGITSTARFAAPSDICVHDSSYYIADTGNHAVRKAYITSDGGRVFDTLLGGEVGFGEGEKLLLDGPKSVIVAGKQMFVSDTNNGRIIRLGNPKELKPVRDYEKCQVEGSADIYINGIKVKFDDVRPIFVEGRTYVPVRVVVESLGGEVNWLNGEKAVLCSYGGFEVKLKESELLFRDERSFVPLRAVAEALGMEVNWLGELRVIEINSIK